MKGKFCLSKPPGNGVEAQYHKYRNHFEQYWIQIDTECNWFSCCTSNRIDRKLLGLDQISHKISHQSNKSPVYIYHSHMRPGKIRILGHNNSFSHTQEDLLQMFGRADILNYTCHKIGNLYSMCNFVLRRSRRHLHLTGTPHSPEKQANIQAS